MTSRKNLLRRMTKTSTQSRHQSMIVSHQQHPANSRRLKHAAESSLKHPPSRSRFWEVRYVIANEAVREAARPLRGHRRARASTTTSSVSQENPLPTNENYKTISGRAPSRPPSGSGIDPRGAPDGQACAGLLPDGSPAPPARRAQQRIRVAARLLDELRETGFVRSRYWAV